MTCRMMPCSVSNQGTRSYRTRCYGNTQTAILKSAIHAVGFGHSHSSPGQMLTLFRDDAIGPFDERNEDCRVAELRPPTGPDLFAEPPARGCRSRRHKSEHGVPQLLRGFALTVASRPARLRWQAISASARLLRRARKFAPNGLLPKVRGREEKEMLPWSGHPIPRHFSS